LVVGVVQVQEGFKIAVLKEGVGGCVAQHDNAVARLKFEGCGGCVSRSGVEKGCGGKEGGTPKGGEGTHRMGWGST
jgi:hypothetical protein